FPFRVLPMLRHVNGVAGAPLFLAGIQGCASHKHHQILKVHFAVFYSQSLLPNKTPPLAFVFKIVPWATSNSTL
ncbi:hypothetical protein RZS08_63845, partial [Arthrospira platensis SPKY1]|nr:hypothetical protein [Arthrospira platensis SPKY1]